MKYCGLRNSYSAWELVEALQDRVDTMAVISSFLLVDIAIAAATFVIAVYLYYANAFRYWKRRGVHYVQPTSILGNLSRVILQREHIGEFLKKVYDNNPGQPVVGQFGGPKPFLVIRDLDVVRNIMVKDAHAFLDRSSSIKKNSKVLLPKSLFFLTGKKWRHMRIKLTPTFTSGKIKKMFYLINECGKALLPCIDQEMSKGNCVVVKDTVARYSTDVIASCAFGVNANALADPECEFRAILRKIFEPNKFQQILGAVSFFAPWFRKLFEEKQNNFGVDRYIRKTFWDVADYRKKNKVVRNDFVDILLQMKNEGHIQAEDANDLEEIKNDSKYMGMEHMRSDKVDIKLEKDDFVAQALLFIVAGFETSSSVISFTLFELALNLSIQDKLRREIQVILAKHNSEVTYDAIAEMNYLEMVVSEAMRKYPTLPMLGRKCLQDYKIPGTDIIIEKGMSIMIPLLGIHLDPAIYPEPDKFDPDRFTPENKSKRSHFAHLPFGEGPRICIGMRFGQMQVKTALVHILISYHVKTCEKTPQLPLGMNTSVIINSPKKHIVLAFEKIK